MKEIKSYKSSDGKIFENAADALAHEYINLKETKNYYSKKLFR